MKSALKTRYEQERWKPLPDFIRVVIVESCLPHEKVNIDEIYNNFKVTTGRFEGYYNLEVVEKDIVATIDVSNIDTDKLVGVYSKVASLVIRYYPIDTFKCNSVFFSICNMDVLHYLPLRIECANATIKAEAGDLIYPPTVICEHLIIRSVCVNNDYSSLSKILYPGTIWCKANVLTIRTAIDSLNAALVREYAASLRVGDFVSTYFQVVNYFERVSLITDQYTTSYINAAELGKNETGLDLDI